jgi:hypothetical protein
MSALQRKRYLRRRDLAERYKVTDNSRKNDRRRPTAATHDAQQTDPVVG